MLFLLDAVCRCAQLPGKKGPEVFKVDEHPRPSSNLESLSKLPSVFKKNGTVTAANASGVHTNISVACFGRCTGTDRVVTRHAHLFNLRTSSPPCFAVFAVFACDFSSCVCACA